jgi:hypothetical protein
LRLLKDQGVPIYQEEVESAALFAIAFETFRPRHLESGPLRKGHSYSVEQMKRLCDSAWGEPLLADLAVVMDSISKLRNDINLDPEGRTYHRSLANVSQPVSGESRGGLA